jgi:hypothetical protein
LIKVIRHKKSSKELLITWKSSVSSFAPLPLFSIDAWQTGGADGSRWAVFQSSLAELLNGAQLQAKKEQSHQRRATEKTERRNSLNQKQANLHFNIN